MEKLLKLAGADRVGEDAKEELRQHLEERAMVIGARAQELSRHANRRTVTAADIRLAGK
jgi:histone H3/H4